MNRKLTTLLTALCFAFALPLAAQLPDEDSYDEPEQEQTEVTAEASVTVDESQDDLDIDGEAEIYEEHESNLDDGLGDDELPRTATPLGILALLGTAGAASALGLRYRRK